MSSSAPHQDIGARLRNMRRVKRMRLKDIAEEVDCSESLLSKIENNKAQPSLKVLHRIASALGTTIGELFADDKREDVIIHRASERAFLTTSNREEKGTIKIERISPFGSDQLLEANIHVIDAGTYSGGEISHAGEEVGYVLEGEFDLFVEDNTYSLREGDSFYFSSELRHSYRNPGSRICRVIWVNTPPTF